MFCSADAFHRLHFTGAVTALKVVNNHGIYKYVALYIVKNTPEGVLIADCHNRKHKGLVIIYLQVHSYWGVVEV